jgi:hypothetical protein
MGADATGAGTARLPVDRRELSIWPVAVRLERAAREPLRPGGAPMKYTLLLYTDHDEWERMSEEAQQQMLQEYTALDEELKAKGILAGGEGLEAVSTATTVRVRDGKRTVTDGPFAETKEALGGFYVIECESLDEAIEWAERLPDARAGSVEIRPVVDYAAMGMVGSDDDGEAAG